MDILVPVGDQIEEELAASPLEGDEAELVDDEDIDSAQSVLPSRQVTRVAGFEQLAH